MSKIVNAPVLTDTLLTSLLSGDIYAIVIPELFKQHELEQLLAGLYKYEHVQEKYLAVGKRDDGKDFFIDYGISFIGASSNRATGKPQSDQSWNDYFKKRDNHKVLLSALAPEHVTPIEHIGKTIDTLHTHGAKCATFFGEEASYGGFRFTYPGDVLEKFPHIDTPRKELEGLTSFSINAYLSVPPHGRDLLIWENTPVYSKKLGDAGVFISKFTENTKPSRIAINAGDVVLFNSCIPHGVASFTWDRPSIAQQTFFIGDPTKPIEFYN